MFMPEGYKSGTKVRDGVKRQVSNIAFLYHGVGHEVTSAKVSDETEFVHVRLQNDMDGHGVHAGQQVRPEQLREPSESGLLITLILKEEPHTVFKDSRFVIVSGDGIDLMLGISPWPEALS